MADSIVIFVGSRHFRIDRTGSSYRESLFAEGIRPDLHLRVCEDLVNQLGDPERSGQASLGLRLHYGMAQEAFFSLLFATLQAPEVPTAWLLLYKPSDLIGLIERFEGGEELPSVWRCSQPGSWSDLLFTLLPKTLATEPETADRLKRLAGFWSEWAFEQRNVEMRAEFNAIKHGLRSRPGSATILIGGQKIEGEEHGSWFTVPDSRGHDVLLRDCVRSWSAENLFARIRLMAISSQNLLELLRWLHSGGKKSRMTFEIPEEHELAASVRASSAFSGLTLGPSWAAGVDKVRLDASWARSKYLERSGVLTVDGTLE